MMYEINTFDKTVGVWPFDKNKKCIYYYHIDIIILDVSLFVGFFHMIAYPSLERNPGIYVHIFFNERNKVQT